MKKLSDSEIKDLFKVLRALMCWPHPVEYNKYVSAFNIRHNEAYKDYKSLSEDKLLALTKRLNLFIKDFPLGVYIETTNECNLRCVMCPHKTLKRKRGKMSQGLFYKIIDEIAKKQPSIIVAPFHFGEPLMDKLIFEKIKYCKEKGLTHVKLSTNGSLLSVNENYKKLVDSGLDRLVISFDAITKKTYESIRVGSKFNNFIEGIDKLMSYKEKTGSKMRVVGQMVLMDNNSHKRKMFSEYVKRKGLEPHFVSFKHWGEPLANLEGLNKLRYACSHPLYPAAILCNGDLAACGMDVEGKYTFGNLKHDSLENLWQKKHNVFRTAQLNGKYDKFSICSNCYDWMSAGYNKYAELMKKHKI